MKTYRHSGAMGDLIYSLPLVKHFGGGRFYLHLNRMNWIGQTFYNTVPVPFHQNRLTEKDWEFMQSFMLTQSYITEFIPITDPQHIDYDLDLFRPLFVNHPGNYIDVYSSAFDITDMDLRRKLRTETWLSVPTPRSIPGKPIVINRTTRWIPPTPGPQWRDWLNQGLDKFSIFVGFEQEYQLFKTTTGWNLDYYPTPTLLDLAEIIAGSRTFIGNQSQCLALSIGLGKHTLCEIRRDLPLDRNECFFPHAANIQYF